MRATRMRMRNYDMKYAEVRNVFHTLLKTIKRAFRASEIPTPCTSIIDVSRVRNYLKTKKDRQ